MSSLSARLTAEKTEIVLGSIFLNNFSRLPKIRFSSVLYYTEDETAARPRTPLSPNMKDADECCGTTVFGCFPGARRKIKQPKSKAPPPPPPLPPAQNRGDSPGGSVQAFYRQNRGKSCRKIMRFNGYPNKVSHWLFAVCRIKYYYSSHCDPRLHV